MKSKEKVVDFIFVPKFFQIEFLVLVKIPWDTWFYFTPCLFLSWSVEPSLGTHNSVLKVEKSVQQVLEYREFDYQDPRNTGIFLMVTIV